MTQTEMTTINRGRFTISANIFITTSTLTRTLIFGCAVLSIYIKHGDSILNENAMDMVKTRKIFEKPLGFTVQSIIFSFPGVLLLELLTGLFGTIGVLHKKKSFLVVAAAFGLLLVAGYIIYVTFLALIYSKVTVCLNIYSLGLNRHPFKLFVLSIPCKEILLRFSCRNNDVLGCEGSIDSRKCYEEFTEHAQSYLETYLGITVTCLISHVVSLIAIDYTYRKIEFKEKRTRLSSNKFYLLLSRQYGIGKAVFNTIHSVWKRAKVEFFSKTTKIILLILHLGILLLGLILCGDVFMTDDNFRYIFYKIKFYQYYFYNILVGFAASAIVTGTLGIVQAILGLAAAWWKSSVPIIVSCLVTTINFAPKLLVFIIYAVFINEINNSMHFQLKLQLDGHYSYDTKNSTCSWNNMTCSNILWKTRMYIGWLLTFLLLQITLGIIGVLLENKEYSMRFQPSSQEDIKSQFTGKCHQVLSIYRLSWTKVKTVMSKNYKRSKATVFYLILLGIIFVLNICILGIVIHIRFVTSMYVWSNVLTTIAVAELTLTFYSALILSAEKYRLVLFIVGITVWIVLTMSNIVVFFFMIVKTALIGLSYNKSNRLWLNYSSSFFILSTFVIVAEIACIITSILLIMKNDEAEVEQICVNINDVVALTELTEGNVDSENRVAPNIERTYPSNDIEETPNDQDVERGSSV